MQQSVWPRGKQLGGSSGLNFMIYSRGHPLDYDNWANLTGDPTWRYENVLPYFKKSLNYNGKFGANSMNIIIKLFSFKISNYNFN